MLGVINACIIYYSEGPSSDFVVNCRLLPTSGNGGCLLLLHCWRIDFFIVLVVIVRILMVRIVGRAMALLARVVVIAVVLALALARILVRAAVVGRSSIDIVRVLVALGRRCAII